MTGQSIWQGHESLAEHTPHTRTFIVQVVVLNTVPQRTEPALTLLTDSLGHGAPLQTVRVQPLELLSLDGDGYQGPPLALPTAFH